MSDADVDFVLQRHEELAIEIILIGNGEAQVPFSV